MEFLDWIKEFINENPGKTVGALLGLIFGILILIFGVLKVFVIAIFIIVGIFIGKFIDDRSSSIEYSSSVFENVINIFRKR